MKFDTVIIGGGLSGLVCGIRLSQQGQRCAIVSSGQSALHFSSGSFDLLNTLPNGQDVNNPITAIDHLISQSPKHPYAKIGNDNFERQTVLAEQFFKEIGIFLKGNAHKNHFRITPLGTLKPTWLSVDDYALVDSNEKLPWKKVSIFNIFGFLDFYPRFIADEFLKLGTESEINLFNLSALDHLRHNPSELRSVNIARVLDSHIEELSEILNSKSIDSEAIIMPGCVGLKASSLTKLKELVKKPLFFIPTTPPSVAGIYMQQYMHNYFLKLGGVYMLGDHIKRSDIEGDSISRVYSFNHGDIPFTANNFVLATGSYFSQGLIATSNRIYEPVFDLDVSYSPQRSEWYNPKIFEQQNYQGYGVKTDNSFRAIHKGKVISNLFVAGAILEGFNPIKEGCGAGVSILSSLAIAQSILNQEKIQ